MTGRGADLPRLLDDEHAAIVNALAEAFRAAGCQIELEASFNLWGERGRIDLFARAPRPAAVLFVIEVKTELADLQDLLGTMSVKTRLAPEVARQLGWDGGRVVAVLAVADTARNRAVVKGHPGLLGQLSRRWFRGRVPEATSPGVLLWVPPRAAGRRLWLAGRRRAGRRAGRRGISHPRRLVVPGGPASPARP